MYCNFFIHSSISGHLGHRRTLSLTLSPQLNSPASRFLFYFFAAPCDLPDLSPPTRLWTWAPAVRAPRPNCWHTRELPSIVISPPTSLATGSCHSLTHLSQAPTAVQVSALSPPQERPRSLSLLDSWVGGSGHLAYQADSPRSSQQARLWDTKPGANLLGAIRGGAPRARVADEPCPLLSELHPPQPLSTWHVRPWDICQWQGLLLDHSPQCQSLPDTWPGI